MKNQNHSLMPITEAPTNNKVAIIFNEGLIIRKSEPSTIDKQLVNVLDRVMKDLGIKNFPDETSSKKIVFFIKANYSALKVEEIELAFDLALLGKFQVDLQHFGEITLRYITRIMNAYVWYKKYVIEPQYKKEEEKMRTKTNVELKQLYEDICIQINGLFQKYKNRISIDGHYYNAIAYDLLDELDFINLKLEEKNKIFSQAAEVLKERILINKHKYESNTAFDNAIKGLDGSTDHKWIAKELALKQWFEERKEHLDITALLMVKQAIYVTRRQK